MFLLSENVFFTEIVDSLMNFGKISASGGKSACASLLALQCRNLFSGASLLCYFASCTWVSQPISELARARSSGNGKTHYDCRHPKGHILDTEHARDIRHLSVQNVAFITKKVSGQIKILPCVSPAVWYGPSLITFCWLPYTDLKFAPKTAKHHRD